MSRLLIAPAQIGIGTDSTKQHGTQQQKTKPHTPDTTNNAASNNAEQPKKNKNPPWFGWSTT
jgi:hypothetical protein